MIILSGVLVVLAIALLIAGILFGNAGTEVVGLDGLTMIYVSITVSIVSALCLAIGVYLRRRELFGKVEVGPAAEAPRAAKKAGKKARKRGKGGPDQIPEGAEPTAEEPFTLPAPPVDVPVDAVVHVVRGRKRYHLDSCRQLAGRDKEELTYGEAQEEGFSPCTACMPDTALAARAAGSDAGSPSPATLGAAGTGPTTAASSSTPGGDWTARRAGGRGREMFVPRPAYSEPGGSIEDEAAAKGTPSTERQPTAEWSRSATPPAEDTAEQTTAEQTTAEQAATERTADERTAGGRAAGRAAARPDQAEEPVAEPDREDAAVVEDDGRKAGAKAPTDDTVATGTAEAAAEDSAAAEPATSAPSAATDADAGPQVRILSGTKRYHRAECALIEDIGDEADDLEALSRAEAKARGCTPCLVCQPDLEQAR